MIILPWPPSSLIPHARGNWHKKAKDTKKYRQDCHWIAKAHKPILEFKIEFYPPDNRRRDLMNTIGSCKAAIDGLQDAWGIDDNNFRIHWPVEFSPPEKNGKIIIKSI